MFRNHLIERFPEWLFGLRIADFPLHVLHARHGSIGYLRRIMATYRVHDRGSFTSRPNADNVREVVRMYDHLNAYLDFRYDRPIRALQNYWQAVEHYRNGDRALARACAAPRVRQRPYNTQALMATLMVYAPALYGLIKRFNPVR
jgi:hypothetical protein